MTDEANHNLSKHSISVGKISGSSPAENRFYVVILFDISDAKKYRALIKILNGYSLRIQKSVFEGHLRRSQIKRLTSEIEQLMSSSRYMNPDDNLRIYKISGNCDVTIFGTYDNNLMEENIFI